MRKTITIVLLAAAIIVPFLAFDVLPVIGDPASAPNTHVSDYYIEHAVSECNSPNMVTAVIVDYRAFDTMFETTVMFLAGLSVFLILANRPKNRIPAPSSLRRVMIDSGSAIYNTINKEVMISVIEPVILIYAMYVLFHGEISLGGGFQAGALIGMVYLLDVMVVGRDRPIFNMPKERSIAVAGLGPLLYAAAGFIPLVGGGLYLEYSKMPFHVHEAELHSIGITIVEIGVTIGVAGTIIAILNALRERISFDDDV